MASTSIKRIIDQARLQLPGVLDGTLRLELFNVLKEFCERTNLWQEDIEVPVQPRVPEYTLPSLEGAQIVRLMWLEGQRSRPNASSPDQRGPRRNGFILRPGSMDTVLVIPHPPSMDEAWHAHITLTVADPTNDEGIPAVPDWIAERYHDYLASGLLSRVSAHGNKPYSNAKLATLHAARFSTGVTNGISDARRMNVFDGQRWAFPQSWGTHSQRYR